LGGHECGNKNLLAKPTLDAYESTGPEGIHSRVLRGPTNLLVRPLSIIFQWSWEPREVQVDCRLAIIVTGFKKGKKEEPNNYRPASLSSEPSKNTEKLFWALLKNTGKTTQLLITAHPGS